MMRRALLLAVTFAALPWHGAFAQAFPAKPLTLVVPFPPGGATDVVARMLGGKLGEKLGQTIVIDNRAGAGTIVGASFVAHAPADGYTMLISSGSTFTINPALNPKLPYDPVKSFEPIGLIGRTPLMLIANAAVPVDNLKQLVAAMKAAPDKYVYGSFGQGTTAHFAGELMWRELGIRLMHVPYKGSAPAMNDLVSGQIPFSVDTITAAMPQIKAGKIKPIAVTSAVRAPQLPAVPTVAESGHPGFVAESWIGVFVPRGVPEAARTRLQNALAETLKDADLHARLVANGLRPGFEPPSAVATLIEQELPRMRATAQRAGIRPE
jgi:tripartite-type tricarboxylate transporter receptor subunit TctC